MNLEEKISKDSLFSLQQSYPSLTSSYEIFFHDVKRHAQLTSEYETLSTSNKMSKKEYAKIILIQDMLHKKERWYTQEIGGVLEALSSQTSSAKTLSAYRSILIDTTKLQKLYGYIDIPPFLDEKQQKIVLYCESQIEHYQPKQLLSSHQKYQLLNATKEVGVGLTYILMLPFQAVYGICSYGANQYASLSYSKRKRIRSGMVQFGASAALCLGIYCGIMGLASLIKKIDWSWPSSKKEVIETSYLPPKPSKLIPAPHAVEQLQPLSLSTKKIVPLATSDTIVYSPKLLKVETDVVSSLEFKLLSKKQQRQLKRQKKKLARLARKQKRKENN